MKAESYLLSNRSAYWSCWWSAKARLRLARKSRRCFWPNDTIVEFDHSINVAIGKLRKALGDSADAPKYIETLARRGYRLMVPVEWIEIAPEPSTGEVSSGDDGASSMGIRHDWADLIGKKVSHYRVLEVVGGAAWGWSTRRRT